MTRPEATLKKDPATSLTLSETELEQVRSDREGLEWLHEFLAEEGALETVQPGGAPSATPISGQAFDLIVEFEVTGEQAYTQRYRRPVWPKGQSGVTIGIGYDVGYACPFRKFHPAWIRIVRQNHRIIESDVCDPARARNVRRRPVQVAVPA